MADIRIKDLTTLESASLTGDVFVIDGTTGTRKLSAFSPTFGGNATVTGNLTVNTALSVTNGVSANELTCTGGYAVLRGFGGSADTGALYLGQSTNNNFISSNLTTMASYIANTAITSTIAAGFRVLTTTASTTTSTGALVVGNGTSGGLGVGGSIYAGANITSVNPQGKIQIQGTGNTSGVKEINLFRSDGGDACTFGLTGSAYNGVFLAGGLGNNEAFIYNAAPFRVFTGTDATTRFDFTTTQFKINPTTISTSTSSGALVVSGGVGVAGAIYAGGDLTVDKTEPTVTFKRAANTNLNIVNFWTGAAADFGIGLRNTTDSDLHIYNYGTSNDALKIAKADSLATFGAAIRTAAPSGGTAANWKLGTVATVSPTSPNRTIEVDIGGTIYYLAAKTTNN